MDTAFGGIQQNRIDEQNKRNLQYQKDLWDYTNAENQVKHYENAGLNVGLMYEGGGNSASTGSFGTGQSQVGKLDIAQNLIAQKQIELIDAQTDKTKAEAVGTVIAHFVFWPARSCCRMMTNWLRITFSTQSPTLRDDAELDTTRRFAGLSLCAASVFVQLS